jgi:hypothetical protein
MRLEYSLGLVVMDGLQGILFLMEMNLKWKEHFQFNHKQMLVSGKQKN